MRAIAEVPANLSEFDAHVLVVLWAYLIFSATLPRSTCYPCRLSASPPPCSTSQSSLYNARKMSTTTQFVSLSPGNVLHRSANQYNQSLGAAAYLCPNLIPVAGCVLAKYIDYISLAVFLLSLIYHNLIYFVRSVRQDASSVSCIIRTTQSLSCCCCCKQYNITMMARMHTRDHSASSVVR